MTESASGSAGCSWWMRQITNLRPSSHSNVLVPGTTTPGKAGCLASVRHRPMNGSHPVSSELSRIVPPLVPLDRWTPSPSQPPTESPWIPLSPLADHEQRGPPSGLDRHDHDRHEREQRGGGAPRRERARGRAVYLPRLELAAGVGREVGR